ncbi:TonB-dependent receptor [Salinibacter altiplanensis]|uniref:TonB-dependent receptor n=1 Tax=Salinibacter altiplanensis TaxID=1803181 RepID=UPI000C9ED0B5|nr:TonB-dependent receptor [Salinibacter altiplanensis]
MRTLRYHTFFVFAAALLFVISAAGAHAQSTGTIQGRVVEAGDETSLPGANVLVQGTSIGTSTDGDGRYEVRGVPAGEQTLTVSFVGFENRSKTVTVEAGQTTTVDFDVSSATLTSGELVVTGLREGQVRSTNQKKQALEVVDVLSATEAGKLPDGNVAESLQRLPGVSIKTDRGEGRFVRVRGTSSNLNNVSLNGSTVASSAGSRATALDLLPSSMISSVEVTKAIRPDMEANAVGGTVNINTLTAFDRRGTFLDVNLTNLQQPDVMEFSDDQFRYEGSATGGTTFGAENQFGIVASLSASRRDFNVSILDPDEWRQDSNLANNETGGNTSFAYPNELETQAEDNERDRISGSLNFDWRPTSQTNLYMRALGTERSETLKNNESELTFAPEDDPIQTSSTTGRFPRGSVELDVARDDGDNRLYSLTLGGDQTFGDVKWSVNSSYSRGRKDLTRYDHTWETPNVSEDKDGDPRAAASYDTGPFFFKLTPENPDYVANPENYTLRTAQLESEDVTENTYNVSTDLRWNTSLAGAEGYLKAGGKFLQRDKVVDFEEVVFDTTATSPAPTLAPFSRGRAISSSQPNGIFFTTGLVEEVTRFTNENLASRNDFNSDLFALDEEETAEESAENDSDNGENIYAGYAMGEFTAGNLTVLGGLRIEHTATDVTRVQLEGADISEETTSSSYTNVLPSIHLKYTLTEDLFFRAAWTNTIGRPDYDLLAQFEEVEKEGTSQINIQRGNPDLEPFRSTNLDLTAEYYLPRGGLLSIGGFYKRIDNPIYSDTRRLNDFTFEGQTFDDAEITETTNVGAGTLLGLEATVDVPLTFLPSPLNGLGVRSNGAYIDSEVSVPGRDDELPFFGQSDLVTNVAPYFQKWGVEARVAWSFQSEALIDVGGEPFEDRYEADRSVIDASLQYDLSTITEGLVGAGSTSVFAQVSNITNESELQYQGNTSQYDRDEEYGRTYEIGLRASF